MPLNSKWGQMGHHALTLQSRPVSEATLACNLRSNNLMTVEWMYGCACSCVPFSILVVLTILATTPEDILLHMCCTASTTAAASSYDKGCRKPLACDTSFR